MREAFKILILFCWAWAMREIERKPMPNSSTVITKVRDGMCRSRFATLIDEHLSFGLGNGIVFKIGCTFKTRPGNAVGWGGDNNKFGGGDTVSILHPF